MLVFSTGSMPDQQHQFFHDLVPGALFSAKIIHLIITLRNQEQRTQPARPVWSWVYCALHPKLRLQNLHGDADCCPQLIVSTRRKILTQSPCEKAAVLFLISFTLLSFGRLPWPTLKTAVLFLSLLRTHNSEPRPAFRHVDGIKLIIRVN